MKRFQLQPAVRFVLSYLLVLCVPMALVWRMWTGAMDMAWQNAYDSTQAMIAQSSYVIDQNLDSLWSYVIQVRASAVNSGYFALPSMRDNRMAVADYKKAVAWLPVQTLGKVNTMLAVYSISGNCIMNSISTSPLNEITYTGAAVLPYGFTYDEYRDSILLRRYDYSVLSESEAVFSSYGKDTDRYLLMAHSVLGGKGALLGNVLLYVRAQDILALAGFTSASSYRYARILDHNGRTLLRYDAPGAAEWDEQIDLGDLAGQTYRTIGGEECLITCVDSSDYGWRYVTATPLTLIRARVGGLLQSIKLLIGTLALLGLSLAFYLAWRNVRPIGRLIRAFQTVEGETPDYEHLDNAVSDLIENSESLKSELIRLQPSMRAALFARWLHGEFSDWAQLAQEFACVGVRLGAGPYAVIVFGFESVRPTGALNSNRAIIKTLLREQLDTLVDIYEMDFSSMVFVSECPDGDMDACRRGLEKRVAEFERLLRERLDVTTAFAGSLAERPSGVPIAYGEAQTAFEQSANECKKRVIDWFDAERQTARQSVFYPIELEMRLIECMKAGDSDGVARILNQLRRENAVKSTIDTAQFKQLVRMLQATMMRLFQQRAQDAAAYTSPIQQVLNNLSDPPSPEEYIRVENVFLSACKDIDAQNRSHSQRLSWRIERFLDANWRDPQLSLQALADHMGYTATYMSRVFKEEEGELFTVYVEKRRMAEAERLLRAGELSVEEVAAATGYASAQVFRRAFRRQHACSPVEYAARAAKGEP